MKIDDDDDEKPMDENEENSDNENKPDSDINPESIQEKFETKLPPDELLDRKIESALLFKETEDLVAKDKERKEAFKKRIIELGSGELRTIESYMKSDPEPYLALFPNDNDYFRQLYRVTGIVDWDPNDYCKPPIIPILLNETIYRRFGLHAPQTLRAKAFQNGRRKHKFSQYIGADGKVLIRKFREDTIDTAKEFGDGQLYEFRMEYARRFNVGGHQYRLDYKHR